ICNILANEMILSQRTIGDVFKFVTDYTIAEYVGLRKLEHIYTYWKNCDCSLETAASEYGFSEYSSFYRKFKKRTGGSPKDMPQEEVEKKLIKPFYLYRGEEARCENVVNTYHAEAQKITIDQYDQFETMQNYQSIYGFDKEEMIYLYDLNQKYNVSLDNLSECRIVEKSKEFETGECWLVDMYKANQSDKADEIILCEDSVIKAISFNEDFHLDFIEAYVYARCGFEYKMLVLMNKHELYPIEVAKFKEELDMWGLTLDDVDDDYCDLYFRVNDLDFNYYNYLNIKKIANDNGFDLIKDFDPIELVPDNHASGSLYWVENIEFQIEIKNEEEKSITHMMTQGLEALDDPDPIETMLDELAYERGEDV
ncbi:MAG: helix-turn-helix domain-containing protein, partial [Lachnospiraceae bacterium]|nr:helix-turn-helix domain-containing protein [Lachnospiraceae bacterium]